MADPGRDRTDYADGILEDYSRLVEKILDAGDGGADTGFGANTSVAANTRDSGSMGTQYPFSEPDRYP